MQARDRFPVVLHYAAPAKYAKGGLVDAALAVKKAGRYGDTEIIHVNKAELAELKHMWGEPTINPQTGQPEFFLGFLKKLLPIAAMFIPGVGPLASAAIGAGSAALNGQGLKGILGGALSGAAGAGFQGAGTLTNMAAQAGGQMLQGANPLTAIGGTVAGNFANAGKIDQVTGKPLAVGAYGQGLSGAAAPGPAIFNKLNSPADRLAAVGGNPTMFNTPRLGAPNYSGLDLSKPIAGASPGIAEQAALKANTDSLFAKANGSNILPGDMPSPVPQATRPNFWNRDFLGIKGVKNKFAVPALVAATALLGKSGTNQGDPPPDQAAQDKFFNPVFQSTGHQPTSGFSDLGARGQGDGSVSNSRAFQAYNAGYMPERANFNYVQGGYAKGGTVSDHDGDEASPFAVRGKGDGRSDSIPAALSDGEYVMDAETVNMLGDGSTKAGAQKLDALRVNLRKHKGRNLAKGKISLAAKSPEAYLRGGRA